MNNTQKRNGALSRIGALMLAAAPYILSGCSGGYTGRVVAESRIADPSAGTYEWNVVLQNAEGRRDFTCRTHYDGLNGPIRQDDYTRIENLDNLVNVGDQVRFSYSRNDGRACQVQPITPIVCKGE